MRASAASRRSRPTVNPGVIDPDGVGKTTPVRIVVGEENPDAGILSLCETVRLA